MAEAAEGRGGRRREGVAAAAGRRPPTRARAQKHTRPHACACVYNTHTHTHTHTHASTRAHTRTVRMHWAVWSRRRGEAGWGAYSPRINGRETRGAPRRAGAGEPSRPRRARTAYPTSVPSRSGCLPRRGGAARPSRRQRTASSLRAGPRCEARLDEGGSVAA